MKFYILRTSLPSPDYQYDPNKYMDFEKLTKDDIKKASFVNKDLMMEHGVPIGKTEIEWETEDGKKIGWSYIDDSTTMGRLAIAEIKNGLVTGLSPGYKLSVYHTPFSIEKYEKDWNELSVTSSPDFDGPGGPQILYGAYENELNINLINHINKLTGFVNQQSSEQPNLLSSSFSSIMQGQQPNSSPPDLSKGVPSATPQSTTPASQSPSPIINPPFNQSPTTSAPIATPTQIGGQNNFPANADPKKIAEILKKNPNAANSLNVEELKHLLQGFATLVDVDQSQAQPTASNAQPNTPASASGGNPTENQRPSVEDAAKNILKSRVASLLEAYDKNAKLVQHPGSSATDIQRGRDALNAWGQELIKNPLTPYSGPSMEAMEVLQTQLVHTNNLLYGMNQNMTARQQVKDLQDTTDANNIRLLMGFGQGQSGGNTGNGNGSGHYGPMRQHENRQSYQQHSNYSPYSQSSPQPQNKEMGNFDEAAWEKGITDQIMLKLRGGGVYNHNGMQYHLEMGGDRPKGNLQ